MSEQDRYEACAKEILQIIEHDLVEMLKFLGHGTTTTKEYTQKDINVIVQKLRRYFEPTDERIKEIAKKYAKNANTLAYNRFAGNEGTVLYGTNPSDFQGIIERALRELRGK